MPAPIVPEVMRDDPNVKLPGPIQAQIARAEELHKHIYPDQHPVEGQQPQPPQPGQQPPPPPPVQPPAPEPAPDTQPSNEVQAQGGAPQPGEPVDWERRFKAMKGRYDTDVARVRADMADIVRANNQLRRELEQLRAGAQTSGDLPAAGNGVRAQRLISEQEEQTYGSEFLDVVARKARDEVGTEVAELKETVSNLRNILANVTGNITQSAEERMFSLLDQRCPKWRQINDDQEFVAWLQLPDVYSGAIRHELLNAAYARQNGPRVLAFFEGYLNEQAAMSPANGHLSGSAPAPGQPAPQPRVALETFAAPGRARTAAPGTPVPADKPILSRSYIAKFFTDVTKGVYDRNPDLYRQKEAEIQAALQEGRVT